MKQLRESTFIMPWLMPRKGEPVFLRSSIAGAETKQIRPDGQGHPGGVDWETWIIPARI
jgi:hypothetical protein